MPLSNEYLLGYQMTVEKCAKNRTNRILPNEGPECARIICSAMFKNACDSVCILANNLCNNDVSGTPEYIIAMDSFLDTANTRLKILLTDFTWEKFIESPQFLASLCNHPNYDHVEIRTLDPVYLPKMNNGVPFHFCVADGEMYRIETDTIQRYAQCNFGDAATGAKLMDIFNNRFADGVKLDFNVLNMNQ